MIFPEEIYVILIKVLMIVDFPAPVLPTIPIFSPLFILHVIPFITSGKSFLYLDFKFINSIFPWLITDYDSSYSGFQF